MLPFFAAVATTGNARADGSGRPGAPAIGGALDDLANQYQPPAPATSSSKATYGHGRRHHGRGDAGSGAPAEVGWVAAFDVIGNSEAQAKGSIVPDFRTIPWKEVVTTC